MDRFQSIVVAVFCVLFTVSARADGARGFEDPVLLGQVMQGKILVEQVLAAKTEFKSTVRAYFNQVSPEAFTDLFTSHKEWVGLIPEIEEAKTLTANAGKTEFTYSMHLKIKYAIFNFDIYPEGKQTVVAGKDALSEWTLYNDITNYKDNFTQAGETVRLIPYQGGILLEDFIHVILATESSHAIAAKKEIEKKWIALLTAFRTKLGGR